MSISCISRRTNNDLELDKIKRRTSVGAPYQRYAATLRQYEEGKRPRQSK